MREVVLAPQAEDDLLGIHRYVAADSPPAAARLLLRIRTALQTLTRLPLLGRVCDTLGDPGLRRFAVDSYLIFYELGSGRVHVLRVLHMHRDQAPLLR